MSQTLPMELWGSIWLFLDIPNRIKVQRVCKSWYEHSIASPRLWKDAFYLRDDQEVRADTELDFSILKQISHWTKDTHFDQISITLRCDTAQQTEASCNFLEILPSTNVRDLVLGSGTIENDSQLFDWIRLEGLRNEKAQQCMNLRSFIVSAPGDGMLPIATKTNVIPTQLEILSSSMNKEHYQGALKEEAKWIRMASRFGEDDPIHRIVTKIRAIDLLEAKEQICDRLTISFLENASKNLEYLTINIASVFNFPQSYQNAEKTTVHLPKLRFLALEADDLRKDALRFNCPNLQSLQVSHVPNLEIFKSCPLLQSLYIKGNFNDKSEYRHFLQLIPKENLRKLFIRTSPHFFREIVHQIHNKSALPNLQKLVVISPIPSLNEQNLLDVYGPSSSINFKLPILVWQCIGMPKENESKEKNGLEFISKHVAHKFIRYNTNPDFPDLATYRFSPTILEEFTEYRNVMEKRKLFFDGNEIRKDFLASRSTSDQN